MRNKITDYIKNKYKAEPEHLWRGFPNYVVYRHSDNNKWFALVMDIPKEKLGINEEGRVDILDVKVGDSLLRDMLIQQQGFFTGYHMNKGSWIAVLLDGTVSLEQVCSVLDESYISTASAAEKQKLRSPKEWIIPANPKYYDIEHAFDNVDMIDWKQGTGIKKEDTVYMYVAAPISAILYKCKVTQTDIPYRFSNDSISIKYIMKIKLLKRYKPNKFTFDVLKNKYEIFAIRGPRSVTAALSAALKR